MAAGRHYRSALRRAASRLLPSATDSIADFLLTLAEEQRQHAVPGLSVSLDGQELHLTPFVQRMLAGALDGMLRTLDGYHEGCEITLRMKSKT